MKTNLRQLIGLLEWSYVRNRSLIFLCGLVQLLMAIALVYGYSLIVAEDTDMNLYIASGTVTIGMITVGCTIAAQTISSAKQDGLVTYFKTLPVHRSLIVLSEMAIWLVASFVGVLLSILVVFIKFHWLPSLSLLTFGLLLLILLTMLSLGFAIAYSTSPSTMAVTTQLILMMGLLFSPIMFPAARIPDNVLLLYRFLPFVPAGDLVRENLYQGQAVSAENVWILLVWLVVLLLLAIWQLQRKDNN